MWWRLEAVYANGVFRPLVKPEGIPERVILTVAEERSSLLRDVVGSISAVDADEMLEIVEREFQRVDSRDWQ
jgi:predicted DNA-binding antitoxin AbrB/MazE fold protein